MQRPNEQLRAILRQAYGCGHFGTCRQAKFDPATGHIPRGFLGATGGLDEVEAIFVIAEPGRPQPSESYSDKASPDELLAAGTGHAHRCFRDGADLFHRNMRWFVDQLWSGLPFDEKLKRAWITEGRLCSIDRKIDAFSDKLYAPPYLEPQLAVMPAAAIVHFGSKAEQRVSSLSGLKDRQVIEARALAPPGANHTASKPSWQDAIEMLRLAREARNVGKPDGRADETVAPCVSAAIMTCSPRLAANS